LSQFLTKIHLKAMVKTVNAPIEKTVNISSPAYQQLVADATARVREGQLTAFRAVNKELIQVYWDLGKMIVERQQTYGWGKSVVEMLSRDLRKAFPNMEGLSARNLWRMRIFYTNYSEILPPPVAEIGWSHNYVIIEKCKDANERLFYIYQTRRNGWTKNVLIHQIENQSYEKTILSQQNFEQTLPADMHDQAILAVKDDYAFGFLELGDKYSEYQLEQAILNNIRQFLIEMGGDFCFIANQFPLDLNDKEYKVDLLLYHRGLQSLVAIDLKIGEFEPEHTGKMSFYLSLLDSKIKKGYERPSIGIIICKSKDATTVEFALRDTNKPIGVATYSFTKSLPKELSDYFPTPEELIKRVEAVIKAISLK
jgi:predicted nuclease of restriction endonuclease-like (RecB) superfamily